MHAKVEPRAESRIAVALVVGALVAALSVVALPVTASAAQRDFSDVEIETIQVAEGIYMLVGAGGNIGLSVGEDGPFVVDDQYAPLTEKIRAAIAELTDDEVRFVINTHWHGDHVGGNENFGEAGALIVAHENVRKRMNPEEFRDVMGNAEQYPDAALPVVTFNDRVTLHWNGDAVVAQHVGHAHTDGDTIVWFTDADVVHMGDNFFNGVYPFIDLDSGGSVDGMLAAVEKTLERAGEETRIIPGHGPLADVDDLRAFQGMLRTVRDRVAAMVRQGASLEEVVAAAPSAEFDDEWGGGWIGPERFVETLYRDLSAG